MRTLLFSLTFALLTFTPWQPVSQLHAQEPTSPAEQIGPYLTADAFAVLHIQVAKLPVPKLTKQLVEMVPEAAMQEAEMTQKLEAMQQAVLAAGGNDIYLVFTKEALPSEPGYLIVPKTEQTNIERLESMSDELNLYPRSIELRDLEHAIVIGRPGMYQQLKQLSAKPRPELAKAFAAVTEHAVQLVVIPTADDRRVIEELVPTLPQELGGGPSTALTRGMQWAAVGLDAREQLKARLVVQSADEAAATAFQEIWQAGLSYLVNLEAVQQVSPKLNEVTDLLTPQVDNDRLTLELHQENKSMETLLAALKPPVLEARIRAKRAVSMNHLKQIALAMHNFYDVHKRFPAIGSVDATGRPLLSWRVHVLPYVEQNSLYQQFHLDEPWDSPHNKTLIEKMPTVFACPVSKHAQSKGLATYRLVVGEGTAFPGRRGIEFKEMTDGTSNTIMAVEVDDQHAVTWTKPEGLPYNAENPLKGLGGQFPAGFHAATCDGAVHFLQQTLDKETLRRLLLRADGQVVEW